MTQKELTTYLIHLTKSLFQKLIDVFKLISHFFQKPKIKRFFRNLIHKKTNDKT
jgi:uncharacterized membrane protein YcfT